MSTERKFTKIFGLVLVVGLLLAMLPVGGVKANDIASAEIVFESQPGYTLTENPDGTYSGVIPAMVDSPFDIYAKEGADAYFDDVAQLIGADHDAWLTWNPDTPDWYQYSLELYEDSGVQKWALRNHAGATAAEPWYADATPAMGVPMSGTMHWDTMYAEETDIGAYLPGTGTAANPGMAASHGGGAGYWDMDWSWGSEAVPLEYPGFAVSIEDLGLGDYKVTLTPEGPVKNLTTNATYNSIQAAVDAASGGDTIHVAAGTYVEALYIDKDVDIVGAGAGSTIIQSPDTLDVCFTSSADNKAVVCIEDADVDLDSLTVDGLGKGNANYRFIGVAFHNAGGSVVNSDVLNITDTPFSGAQHGTAIYSYNEDAIARSITVQDCLVEGFQKTGIALNANSTTPLTVNVNGNTVIGAGSTDVTAQNGVQVWGAMIDGVINANSISGIYYINPDPPANGGSGWAAMGILDYDSADITISENTITDSQFGIGAYGTNSQILGNDISVLRSEDYYYSEGIQVGNWGGSAAAGTTVIAGNVISITDTATSPTRDTYGIDVQVGDYDLEATIDQNTVTGFGVGISLWDGTLGDGITLGPVTVTNNIVTGSNIGIWPDTLEVAPVIEFNQLTDSTDALQNDSGLEIDASPNWWGSVTGPTAGQISGADSTVYSPWCGDAECTFLVDAVAGTDLQASIDALGGSGTLYVPAGTYGQTGAYTLGGVTLILADGTVIQNSSPCFTVTASHTKITTESIGGAVCVPTSGSSGIVVDGGLQDITIEGLEIKGDEVTGGLHGIEFVGGVDYVTIVNNYIHDLTGSAISFGGLVTNNLGIQGNLFMGLDVTYPGPDVLDASYNSWGGYDPAPTMANVDTLPFTYVGLEAASSGALSVDQVAQGGTVTYTVTAKITEVAGMDFVLTYPTALLTSPVISNVTTAFTGIPLTSDPATYGDLVSVDEGAGRIRFNGVAAGYEPVTTLPDGGILFTVTFTATDALTVGTLEFVDDVFSMIPSSTPYAPSNNIYASLLTDGVVSVVELPTITAIGYDGVFVAGVPEEFYLDIDNPADGGTFANPWLQFNLAGSGATLEYFNGVDWVDASGGLDLSAMAPGDFMDDFLFRITFPTRGSYAITATLVDGDAGDAFLASVELGASVAGNFDVYGTFTMQGRTTRSGITVNLTMADPALYGPYSGVTEDFVPNNLFIAGVTEATYTVTTVQPRYLNVTADLGIEITVSGEAYFMNLLQLMGGNADWSDNEITLSDASIVGSMYGIGGIEDDADVNFDGRVNIQDLALVGGNYTLTSADVYGTWLP